jgi:hypothetical protein
LNIPPGTLTKQFYAARERWGFIDDVERRYGLPRCLLYAVGSRETNLRDVTGDGGHGRGVFQLDDRSHTIPDPFPVEQQAEIAGAMLRGLLDALDGDVVAAACAYNAGTRRVRTALSKGRDPNSVTTGKDYGTDVRDRARFCADLASPLPPAPAPNPEPVVEDEMLKATDPTNGDFWLCRSSDGAVYSFDHNGEPHNRYYGGANARPDWNVGAGKPLGAVVAIEYWPDDPEPDEFGRKGYLLVSASDDGEFHTYRLRGSGADAKAAA